MFSYEAAVRIGVQTAQQKEEKMVIPMPQGMMVVFLYLPAPVVAGEMRELILQILSVAR